MRAPPDKEDAKHPIGKSKQEKKRWALKTQIPSPPVVELNVVHWGLSPAGLWYDLGPFDQTTSLQAVTRWCSVIYQFSITIPSITIKLPRAKEAAETLQEEVFHSCGFSAALTPWVTSSGPTEILRSLSVDKEIDRRETCSQLFPAPRQVSVIIFWVILLGGPQ